MAPRSHLSELRSNRDTSDADRSADARNGIQFDEVDSVLFSGRVPGFMGAAAVLVGIVVSGLLSVAMSQISSMGAGLQTLWVATGAAMCALAVSGSLLIQRSRPQDDWRGLQLGILALIEGAVIFCSLFESQSGNWVVGGLSLWGTRITLVSVGTLLATESRSTQANTFRIGALVATAIITPILGVTVPDHNVFAGSLAVIAAIATLTWVLRTRRETSYVEGWWSLHMAFVACESIMLIDGELVHRQVTMAGLRSVSAVAITIGMLTGFSAVFRTLQRTEQSLTERFSQELRRLKESEPERTPETIAEELDSLTRGGMLDMVFQPVVRITDGSIEGYEALARFRTTPYRTPDLWFQDAAAVGRQAELETWAVRCALHDAEQLDPRTSIAINVSAATLSDPTFFDAVQSLDPRRVIIEITEHDRVDDYSLLVAELARYRRLGIRIAVDDVGAGFSSMTHVVRVEPDIIKLDRSLVSGIQTDPIRASLARCLVDFAHEISAIVIAEGVESDEEREAIQRLGIDLGQGWLFGRPEPAAKAAAHQATTDLTPQP